MKTELLQSTIRISETISKIDTGAKRHLLAAIHWNNGPVTKVPYPADLLPGKDLFEMVLLRRMPR
jgi:hypothetical protein